MFSLFWIFFRLECFTIVYFLFDGVMMHDFYLQSYWNKVHVRYFFSFEQSTADLGFEPVHDDLFLFFFMSENVFGL